MYIVTCIRIVISCVISTHLHRPTYRSFTGGDNLVEALGESYPRDGVLVAESHVPLQPDRGQPQNGQILCSHHQVLPHRVEVEG